MTHWNCSNFEKQWYYAFDKEERDLEKQIVKHIIKTLYVFNLLKHHKFESNFEHWNFTSNKIYSLEKNLEIQIIALPLWFVKNT